jgi:hypothetical protein
MKTFVDYSRIELVCVCMGVCVCVPEFSSQSKPMGTFVSALHTSHAWNCVEKWIGVVKCNNSVPIVQQQCNDSETVVWWPESRVTPPCLLPPAHLPAWRLSLYRNMCTWGIYPKQACWYRSILYVIKAFPKIVKSLLSLPAFLLFFLVTEKYMLFVIKKCTNTARPPSMHPLLGRERAMQQSIPQSLALTVVLQWWYSGVTIVLQLCNSGVTVSCKNAYRRA